MSIKNQNEQNNNPKTYAINKPTRSALMIGPIIFYLNKILTPLVFVINKIVKAFWSRC